MTSKQRSRSLYQSISHIQLLISCQSVVTFALGRTV